MKGKRGSAHPGRTEDNLPDMYVSQSGLCLPDPMVQEFLTIGQALIWIYTRDSAYLRCFSTYLPVEEPMWEDWAYGWDKINGNDGSDDLLRERAAQDSFRAALTTGQVRIWGPPDDAGNRKLLPLVSLVGARFIYVWIRDKPSLRGTVVTLGGPKPIDMSGCIVSGPDVFRVFVDRQRKEIDGLAPKNSGEAKRDNTDEPKGQASNPMLDVVSEPPLAEIENQPSGSHVTAKSWLEDKKKIWGERTPPSLQHAWKTFKAETAQSMSIRAFEPSFKSVYPGLKPGPRRKRSDNLPS